MDITQYELSELRVQLYEGTKTNPVETELESYGRKEAHRKSDVAELFHENTKTSAKEVSPRAGVSASRFVTEPVFEYATARLPPGYRAHEEIQLPEPTELEISLGNALERRRSVREYTGEGLSRQTLSNLLYYGCGEVQAYEAFTADSPLEEGEQTVRKGFKTYPSPGALYPVETYVVVVNPGPDTDTGVYHYDSAGHALHRLGDAPPSPDDADETLWSGLSIEYGDAATWVLLTGAIGRVKAKYGPRGYRLLLLEAGHLSQNLQLAATATDIGSVASGGYNDRELNDLLDVDGVDEAIVHALALGVPEGDGSDG